MKKSASVLLAITMLITMMSVFTLPSSAAQTSGTTGDCTWTLDGTVLTISGIGDMDDYTDSQASYPPDNFAPWKYTPTEVIIESGVTSIGDFAFCYCWDLANVTIPNSVTSIGSGAFYNCVSLTSVTIPDGVTSIGSHAFYGCDGMRRITIPGNVTSIGDFAFSECGNLMKVSLSKGVKNIGSSVFAGCENLVEISLPSSLTGIGGGAFGNCTRLSEVAIPNGLDTISNSLFYGCTSLTSMVIPETVTSIGSYAFYGCSKLYSITLPAALTRVNSCAFQNCNHIYDVYFTGTEDQWWDNVYIENGNKYNQVLLDATVHYDVTPQGVPEKHSVNVSLGHADFNRATAGETVTIYADSPATSLAFDKWVGEEVTFEDETASKTTFTMPDTDVTITATYKLAPYAVTVIGGTADKLEASPGSLVTITAVVPAGYVFDKWTGEGLFFADTTAFETTFTMPAAAVTIEAMFKDPSSTTSSMPPAPSTPTEASASEISQSQTEPSVTSQPESSAAESSAAESSETSTAPGERTLVAKWETKFGISYGYYYDGAAVANVWDNSVGVSNNNEIKWSDFVTHLANNHLLTSDAYLEIVYDGGTDAVFQNAQAANATLTNVSFGISGLKAKYADDVKLVFQTAKGLTYTAGDGQLAAKVTGVTSGWASGTGKVTVSLYTGSTGGETSESNPTATESIETKPTGTESTKTETERLDAAKETAKSFLSEIVGENPSDEMAKILLDLVDGLDKAQTLVEVQQIQHDGIEAIIAKLRQDLEKVQESLVQDEQDIHDLQAEIERLKALLDDDPTEPTDSTNPTEPTTTGTEEPMLGDANGDSAVNMKDVLMLRKYLADMTDAIDLDTSDVNGDGTVNMKDVLTLRKYLADMIDTLRL